MKLKIALASTLLVVLGATTAQAADTRTPDILSSVASDSVQKMTENEASKARGEYYEIKVSYNPITGKKTFSKHLRIKWRSHYPSNSTYVSSDGTIHSTKIVRLFHVWRLHVSR